MFKTRHHILVLTNQKFVYQISQTQQSFYQFIHGLIFRLKLRVIKVLKGLPMACSRNM
jgi:hypothetical protein